MNLSLSESELAKFILSRAKLISLDVLNSKIGVYVI